MKNNTYPSQKNSSWIELDKSAFKKNVGFYRDNLKQNVKLGFVIKGNAYGHGFLQMLPLVYENPIDVLFISNPHEGFYIREFEQKKKYPPKRIVIIGNISYGEICKCFDLDIEIMLGVAHHDYGNYFKNLASNSISKFKKLKVHLHVDTGFNREGILDNNLQQTLVLLKKYDSIVNVQGVMSHFANADNKAKSLTQIKLFEKNYKIIVQFLGLKYKPEKHIAQSSATLTIEQSQLDIVRIGIGLFGYYSECLVENPNFKYQIDLQPILSWKVQSQSVHIIPKGSVVGYQSTFKANRDTRIALLPVGYFDGYPRLLSNKGYVLVKGVRCDILGRVMMNYIVVDVTQAVSNDDPVEAILIGRSETETVCADLIAKWCGTIEREVLTGVGEHLKRSTTNV